MWRWLVPPVGVGIDVSPVPVSIDGTLGVGLPPQPAPSSYSSWLSSLAAQPVCPLPSSLRSYTRSWLRSWSWPHWIHNNIKISGCGDLRGEQWPLFNFVYSSWERLDEALNNYQSNLSLEFLNYTRWQDDILSANWQCISRYCGRYCRVSRIIVIFIQLNMAGYFTTYLILWIMGGYDCPQKWTSVDIDVEIVTRG